MYPSVSKWRIRIILAILACIAQLSFAQSPIQLRSYGWEPPESHQFNEPSIAIDHKGRVLVGFTVRERNGLVTRDQPSFSFHIARFWPDGKPDLLVSLPTDAAGRTGTYLSDTDQIIARANNYLQLLQSEDGNPQDGKWRILAPCIAQCNVVQSHSRHTLLLHTEGADPPLMLIHLSPQPAFQRCGKAHQFIKSAEDSIQNFPQSISDEFAYFSVDGDTYRWPHCDYAHRVELPVHIRGRWTVLNDKTFVANPHNARRDQSGLEVISSEGQVKFRWAVGKHETADTLWVPIRSSERGNRIAVDVPTLRGGNRALDISDHVTARRIAVYDIEAGKEVASITVNATHRCHYEFDLSPDGHRLRILEDDVVRIVDLDGGAKSNTD